MDKRDIWTAGLDFLRGQGRPSPAGPMTGGVIGPYGLLVSRIEFMIVIRVGVVPKPIIVVAMASWDIRVALPGSEGIPDRNNYVSPWVIPRGGDGCRSVESVLGPRTAIKRASSCWLVVGD